MSRTWMSLLTLVCMGCWSGNLAWAQTCQDFDTPEITGNLQQSKLNESSGLTVSRRNRGVFWSHNDSGGKPRIFAFDAKGKGLGTFLLKGAKNVDWEDMAAGPCPDGSSCLFLADVGDNYERRREITIYRIKEPKADSSTAGKEIEVDNVEVFTLRYPDTSHNCETLLVHPKTGDILLVTKTLSRTAKIYGLDGKKQPGTHVLEQKGSLTTSETFLTGGDWSPTGTQIVIRGYSMAFVYTVGDAMVPEDKHLTKAFQLAKTAQGEAITFSLDGKTLWTTTEKLPAPIHKYNCKQWTPAPEPTPEPAPSEPVTDAGNTSDKGAGDKVDVDSPTPSACNCQNTTLPPTEGLWWSFVLFAALFWRRRRYMKQR